MAADGSCEPSIADNAVGARVFDWSPSGTLLSSGIYFYRFEWEGERRTGKSVIVR